MNKREYVIEWHEAEPLPPGVIYKISFPPYDQTIGVKVASNQRDLTGGFTIRARVIESFLKEYILNKMDKQLKETLAGLGLSKQEVEIILGAISGVKIAPLAYSSLNDATAEIVEAREYKSKVETALSAVGVNVKGDAPKKERKPRSDKGTVRKAEDTPPAKSGDGAADVPMRVVDEKTEIKATKGEKKKPTPRAKESEEEIKQNVAALNGGGEQAPPPGVDL